MREQPEQQAPPAQRLRVRYAKRGRLRFASHRDFSRAFERAVARARIPVAYSSGFHPHPRISFAGAAPTGAASEAEYLEIGLARAEDPDAVRHRLASAMPDGLDIVDVVVSPGGSLADLLTGSRWRLDLGGSPSPGDAVARFLARDQVVVERLTKKGLRSFDCRSAVVALRVLIGALDLVLRHQTPAVRPDDVVAGLVAEGWQAGPDILLTRLDQGLLDEDTGEISDPLRVAL